MTDNDKLFLRQVQEASKHNRESDEKVSLVTNKGLLSAELLNMFEVSKNHQGAWFFNVYVEFEPMFKQRSAKDWQK